jgi:hypothetical protein
MSATAFSIIAVVSFVAFMGVALLIHFLTRDKK